MKSGEIDINRRKLLLAAGIGLVPAGLINCGGGTGGGGGEFVVLVLVLILVVLLILRKYNVAWFSNCR